VQEALFAQIEPGLVDYTDMIEKLRGLGVDVLFYTAYAPEAGLIIRQARERGYGLQMIGGDGIGIEDFGLIAGSAGNGTVFTSVPDLVGRLAAAPLVTKFRDEGLEPSCDVVLSYAAIQTWAQAVGKAATFETGAVAEALRARLIRCSGPSASTTKAMSTATSRLSGMSGTMATTRQPIRPRSPIEAILEAKRLRGSDQVEIG